MQTGKAVGPLRLLSLRKHHVANHLHNGVAEQLRVFAPALRLNERDAHHYGLIALVDHARREVVLRTGLHHDTAKAVVLQAEAFPATIVLVFLDTLRVKIHPGVRLIELRIATARAHNDGLDIAEGVAGAYDLPRRGRSPAIALIGVEFETAILNQLGIQAAIGRG